MSLTYGLVRPLLAALGLALTFGLVISLPTPATAQDTGPTSSIYCPNLTQSLSMGSRDSQTNPRGQVTELQRFLSDYYDLNPDDYVTGYFGRLTRDNVRKFQCEKMSICSGSEGENGWGFVGRMTRAAIAQSCGMTTVVPPISCPIYSPPQCTGGTLVSQGVDANGCQRPFRCDMPNASASCTFNGKIIAHGQSVTAYQAASVPAWTNCTAEVRSCSNGTLSGSYQYATCSPQGVTTASCTFNGQTVAHGQSVTAYEASWVGPGKQCISQTRTCANGALSGSYAFHSCYTQTVNCPLLSPPQCTGGTLVSNGNDANGCSLGYRCEMPAGNASCVLSGITRNHGESAAFYSVTSSTNCAANSQTRTCQNGTFGGGAQYQHANCTQGTTGGGTGAGTISLPTASGASQNVTVRHGDIIGWSWPIEYSTSPSATMALLTRPDTRLDYIISGGAGANGRNSIDWYVDSYVHPVGAYTAAFSSYNSPTIPFNIFWTSQVQLSVVSGSSLGSSCLYHGEAKSEGTRIQMSRHGVSGSLDYICDNGVWVMISSPPNATDGTPLTGFSNWVSKRWVMPVYPRHGNAPFTITVGPRTRAGAWCGSHLPYTLNWGDGTAPIPATSPTCPNTPRTATHTYTARGSYTISLSDAEGNVEQAVIRVD